jgi:uncharacterized cupin superfamily protein
MVQDQEIVTFGGSVEAQQLQPDAARILSGQPRQTLWNHFTDSSQQFFAGEWVATPGSWRIHYSENEFCHLLAGRVALTNRSGRRWEFARGDSFVVPAGFEGVWEVIEDCRKLYAIFESRG